MLFQSLEERARRERSIGFIELLLDAGRDSQARPIEAYWTEAGYMGFHIPLSQAQSRTIKSDLRGRNIRLKKHLKDGQPSVTLTLRNPQFRTIFEVFCDSILEAIDEDPENAGPNVVMLHNRWKSLLATSSTKTLSQEVEIGLICELQTLEALLVEYGEKAFSYWEGPTFNRHDFVLPDRSIECKATLKRNGLFITIHGKTQLDRYVSSPLELHVRKYETSPNGAISLPSLVNSLLQNPQVPSFLLLDKLLEVGYSHSFDQLDSPQKYNLLESHQFQVVEDFPCIPLQNLSDRVQQVQYVLDLSSPESVPGYLEG